MQQEINFITRPGIIFGKGETSEIGCILKNKNMNKALIYTDKGIIKAGLLERIENSLRENKIKYKIFAEIETNPLKSIIRKGIKKTVEFEPDIIIAIGGGSVLDTAKAVAFYYSNPGLALLGDTGELKGGYSKFPVITIPTTAGTGSEITSWSVITDPDIPEKVSIGGACIAPELAVIDPEMTLTLSPKLTLWTGMDAFIHALEAYLSSISNDYVNKIAYLAMEYVVNNLEIVVKDASNLLAREKMLLASYLAGWAMENVGLGLVHGMSHQVGAYYNHHHGLLNALLLPYIIEYNYPACEKKMDDINKLFKTGNDKDLAESIFEFYDNLGLNTEILIERRDIPCMAKMAVENVNSKTNPRKPELEDVKKIYHRAFKVKDT